MKRKTEEITFKELLSIFLPKFWISILCGVIFAGVVVAYSTFHQKDQYTAYTTIYVYMERENNSASGTYYDVIVSEKMVKTYSIILKSRAFLSKVVEFADPEGKYGLTPNAIAAAITIKQVEGTEVFGVYCTSSNSEISYNIISGIAELAPTELKEIISSTKSDVKIIDPPVMPIRPDGKQTARNSMIGFLIGLVLSMAVLFIVNRFDIIIHDKKKIEDHFDLPVLGLIPRHVVVAKKNGGDGNNV